MMRRNSENMTVIDQHYIEFAKAVIDAAHEHLSYDKTGESLHIYELFVALNLAGVSLTMQEGFEEKYGMTAEERNAMALRATEAMMKEYEKKSLVAKIKRKYIEELK